MSISPYRFYVYGHYAVDTNELFYIGKGTGNRHKNKRRRNVYWNNIVNKHGFRSEILIDNLLEDEAFLQEYLAIKDHNPRANLVPGGHGLTSEMAKNQWNNPNFRESVRLAQKTSWKSSDRSEKASNMMKLRWQNPEEIGPILDKIIKSNKDRLMNRTPEEIETDRKYMNEIRKNMTPEIRAKAIEKALLHPDKNKNRPKWTEEKRKQMSRKGIPVTRESNLKRAVARGGGPFLVFKKETNELVGEWIIKTECATILGLDVTRVSDCLAQKPHRYTHKGYFFKYKDNK